MDEALDQVCYMGIRSTGDLAASVRSNAAWKHRNGALEGDDKSGAIRVKRCMSLKGLLNIGAIHY